MNGIIVIDKPPRFTSFDVVAVMRGLFGTKKVGHTGTLDPMATGVLPILIGSATKAQDLTPDSGKEYVAGFRLGVVTDTEDSTGTVKETFPVTADEKALESALSHFRGEILQVPPMSLVTVLPAAIYAPFPTFTGDKPLPPAPCEMAS